MDFADLSDAEIVARMRQCNYEKFKSFVRMHLSFELNLNKDDLDLPCHEIVYEDKGKLQIHKKKCGSSPPESLRQAIDQGFLFHLQELKEFLMSPENIKQEGIFRKTGSASRQNELRLKIQDDKPLDLEAGGYSAHDCATVLKGYLAELPEPLLTDAHYPAHLQIAALCIAVNSQLDDMSNEQKIDSISTTSSVSGPGEGLKHELHILNSIQLLLLLLPDDNRELLQHIIDMLHNVALQQHDNKMGPNNLATLFAPNLMCPRLLPPEVLHYLALKMSSIVSYMIVWRQHIFSVPVMLATDIRAHFLGVERKKTMAPEMTLEETTTDASTINTVYTSADREKSAAASSANTTDTELAQLYDYMESMPESSEKRRLVKKFNKLNEQAMNRSKTTDSTSSAKSWSDMSVMGKDVFAVAAKLAKDISAKFLEVERKKTMAPEMTLEETTTDASTINTVYTSADREKSAAASSANTTDTELARLYDYMESMPESSEKRRLVKKFNKLNEQAMNRSKTTDSTSSAKSWSDMSVMGKDVFAVAAKLAKDISAKFLEVERKKTMAPEMTLEETTTDASTINTVYTSADREKSAAASSANTTDTELARLYDYVQLMPESSEKRRLVKKFNKLNEQAMNRSKTTDSTLGAKSLSDMSVSGKDVFAVPAKPVYTSADREKSAAASSANTTDTELARLYDYVQLMPESSEKRRLVKKFNKLNEQAMNRSKTTDSTLGAKSLSDMSVSGKDVFAVPAKPVYTSADREKSAAASSANTTDTELARLYDYMQLMPESSEKRRLVKKFNKLNEQAMNRSKTTDSTSGTKSWSDSIKKHIFHKGLMSRTPQRQPVPSIVLESPKNSSMKLHEQNVPFQSPNSQTILTSSTDTTNFSASSSFPSTSSSSICSLACDYSYVFESDYLGNPSTPLQQPTTVNDLKYRYTSEPNLSVCHNLCETTRAATTLAHDMITPITKPTVSSTDQNQTVNPTDLSEHDHEVAADDEGEDEN